jgi:cell shape-determining protein MreC
MLGPASLALAGLLALFLLLRAFVPGALAFLATPFWATGTVLTAGVGNTGTFFTGKAEIARERDRLLAENAALIAQQAALSAREADLIRLLGSRTEPAKGILAGVLARPPVSPYDVLVVDAGSKAGIVEGARALGLGGVPLGTVESVAPGSSRITLYSTPLRETEAWIGEARIPVTLIGEGSGAFAAEVARESGIKEGDMAYVASGGAFPIGTVMRVESDPSSPRSRVDIKPVLNPFSVTWVSIMP